MNLPMVDCRSLVEFCRSFDHHRTSSASSSSCANTVNSSSNRSMKRQGGGRVGRFDSWNPLSHPFCHHSPFAAVDIAVLLLALAALSFLAVPYLSFLLRGASAVLPAALALLEDAGLQAPLAYSVGLVAMFAAAVALWEILGQQARKCGNPYCRGLRKAVEFDIQLESEECVKYMPRLPKDVYGARPLELGQDHKELEAELKRMAPLNGRTVLIFRAPCGCPAGRMEVWGPKKPGRIKK